jgi:proteasome lid subunit RPN8/RPN11
VLQLPRTALDEIVALALDAYPYECCGLLVGPAATGPTGGAAARLGTVTRFAPCRNAAESAKVYTIDPRDHLRAERDAEEHGWEIIGVVHSHTHSEPYPSPTDVRQAPDPGWHYVIVGLKRDSPELRSYSIVDGAVDEESIDLV